MTFSAYRLHRPRSPFSGEKTRNFKPISDKRTSVMWFESENFELTYSPAVRTISWFSEISSWIVPNLRQKQTTTYTNTMRCVYQLIVICYTHQWRIRLDSTGGAIKAHLKRKEGLKGLSPSTNMFSLCVCPSAPV